MGETSPPEFARCASAQSVPFSPFAQSGATDGPIVSEPLPARPASAFSPAELTSSASMPLSLCEERDNAAAAAAETSCMDLDESVNELALPTVPSDHIVPKITVGTLRRLLTGEFRDKIDHFVIFDCRYYYEYDGGHIEGALNICRKVDFQSVFKANRHLSKRVALIFHCEYSKDRAPRLASFFRNFDREQNKYPHLTFPNIYVVEGGYKRFYEESVKLHPRSPSFCTPNNYISMWDERWKDENKRCTYKFRQSWCVRRYQPPRRRPIRVTRGPLFRDRADSLPAHRVSLFS